MKTQDLAQIDVSASNIGTPAINQSNPTHTIDTSTHQERKDTFITFSHATRKISGKKEKYLKGEKLVYELQMTFNKALNVADGHAKLELNEYKEKINQLNRLVKSMEFSYREIYQDSNGLEDGYHSDHSELFECQRFSIEESFAEINESYKKLKAEHAQIMTKLKDIIAVDSITPDIEKVIEADAVNVTDSARLEPKSAEVGCKRRRLDFDDQEDPNNEQLRVSPLRL